MVGVINRARLGRGERDEDPIWVRGASAPCAVLPGPLVSSLITPRPLPVPFFIIFKIKKEGKTSNILTPSLKEYILPTVLEIQKIYNLTMFI
jgi:hypothetical protein